MDNPFGYLPHWFKPDTDELHRLALGFLYGLGNYAGVGSQYRPGHAVPGGDSQLVRQEKRLSLKYSNRNIRAFRGAGATPLLPG